MTELYTVSLGLYKMINAERNSFNENFTVFKAYSGKKMLANCYKCADKSEPPHYMAWSPIVGEPFRFHRPECFGEMIFE